MKANRKELIAIFVAITLLAGTSLAAWASYTPERPLAVHSKISAAQTPPLDWLFEGVAPNRNVKTTIGTVQFRAVKNDNRNKRFFSAHPASLRGFSEKTPLDLLFNGVTADNGKNVVAPGVILPPKKQNLKKVRSLMLEKTPLDLLFIGA
ncbi:MAG: hypothetical protein MI802_23655 [Desulfobacterales bacterium]|nr:hypothetical protein [Desulfobacterales bacterium]